MNARAQLVTGATGFVGSALVLELLAETTDHVLCIVRPHEGVTVQDRLVAALETAANAYDVGDDLCAQLPSRVTALEGDVQLPACGVGVPNGYQVHQFWHSAASLRFEDRYAEEIFAINTEGTRNALALAEDLGVDVFNYMSTAYVAGAAEGTVLERPSSPELTNNLYERSKVAAEALVADTDAFGVRVFRPSIVVGHSRTQAATNFTGMYGFLRKLYAFNGMMARTQRELLQRTSMQLEAEGNAPLDLVPIDRVVVNAVKVMKRTAPEPGTPEYFHLTNPTPPTVGQVLELMFSELGMRAPTLVDGPEDFSWLDEQFNGRIDFYRSYIRGEKRFDRTNTDRHVDEDPVDAYRMNTPELRSYCRWYLDRLDAERAALPGTR